MQETKNETLHFTTFKLVFAYKPGIEDDIDNARLGLNGLIDVWPSCILPHKGREQDLKAAVLQLQQNNLLVQVERNRNFEQTKILL